jgi:hypothetical protein
MMDVSFPVVIIGEGGQLGRSTSSLEKASAQQACRRPGNLRRGDGANTCRGSLCLK